MDICLNPIFLLEFLMSASLLQRDADALRAANLVEEVYELVAENYLDARSAGFELTRSVALCYGGSLQSAQCQQH